MHNQVHAHLHEARSAALRTKQFAQLTIYWPGTENDKDNFALACRQCQDHLPLNAKEPIIHKVKPN